MKVAQFLSTVPTHFRWSMPRSWRSFRPTRRRWLNFVRRRMASELGPDWQAKFTDFSHEGRRGESRPGDRAAAGRLQRRLQAAISDMPSTVEADLRQIRLAMAIYNRMDNTIQQEEIYKDWFKRLREELDYTRERRRCASTRSCSATIPACISPCRWTVLHQAPADHDVARRPAADDRLKEDPSQDAQPHRRGAVPRLVRAILSLRRDPRRPHLGNYQVRPDGSINLLDFGAIRVFAPGLSAA